MIGHRQATPTRSNGVTYEAVCTCGTGFYVARAGLANEMLTRHINLALQERG